MVDIDLGELEDDDPKKLMLGWVFQEYVQCAPLNSTPQININLPKVTTPIWKLKLKVWYGGIGLWLNKLVIKTTRYLQKQK